ncbi:MAG TPA: hypothetical protein VFS30_10745 [Dehalococcoidia bacterium]|nr:hypothetical protein [Dehalococcoidia bacterium]
MKKPIIIAGAAAIVALVVIAGAFALSGDDESPPASGGGGAAGSCPAENVPGISQEERERCFEQDSPGTGAPAPDATSGTKLPGLPDDRRAVEAPIDGLEVLTLESFPPQYMLHVQAGLPSGCAEQYGSEVERVGDVITITVLNTIPADENVACTAIYGMYEFNMGLGSDFESGETYTVRVNDQEITFTAQ